MKAVALALAFLALCGCNREGDPFLGKWNGAFEVTKVNGETDLSRNNLNGYLQIYATKKTYKLHLKGEQVGVQAGGRWTVEGNRITLAIATLAIDDMGGEQQRDLTKKHIPTEDLRSAYRGSLVLQISDDGKRLVGLETQIGALEGRHQFEKVTHEYTYD